MKNKTPRMWDFEKVDGKWKATVSGDFLYYMHSTMGFPVELAIEEINMMSKAEVLTSQLESWKEFVEENNIDIEPMRVENNERSEEIKQLIDEIYEK